MNWAFIFMGALGTIGAVGILAVLGILAWLIFTQPSEETEPTPEDALTPGVVPVHTNTPGIRRYWAVVCRAGPEIHGLASNRRDARGIKTMLDDDEPTHRHVVTKFYPWVPVAEPARMSDNRTSQEVS